MAAIEIIPDISGSRLESIEGKLRAVAPYISWAHVDISDGTYFGLKTAVDNDGYRALIRQYPHCLYEAHLVLSNPEKHIRPLVQAGFSRLIAHVESNDPRRFLEEAQHDEVEIELAIDGATEVEQIEPFLEEIDGVFVATVEMGVKNGEFLPEAVERIKLIRQNYPDIPITAAGGIHQEHARTLREAGATRIVADTYIFASKGQEKDAIERLKS